MKKLIYTLALVVIGFTASYAQKFSKQNLKQGTAPELRAEKAINAWQKKLNLTTDQKSKIKQIELDRIKKHDEWRNKDQRAMKNKIKKRHAFMKSNKEKMHAILTPDQKKKLAESRTEMGSKMKERKGEKGKRAFRNSKTGKAPSKIKPVN